jgi:hypothetical protein
LFLVTNEEHDMANDGHHEPIEELRNRLFIKDEIAHE